MRVTLRIAILVGAVVLCSACSIFFDTGEYWRAADAGTQSDAAPPPDGGSPDDAATDGGQANRPPRLTAARLDRYLVFEDETLRAVPIGMSDPDGDAVRIEYRWLAGDAPLTGELDAALDFTTAGVTAGARVSVQLTPVDDHDLAGAPITVGPIVVLPDETRWRPLAPSRNAPHPIVGFDRTGRRLLLVEATTPNASRTWELPLDDPEAPWVALDAGGDSPPALEGAAAASSDTRLFVLGGVHTDSTPNDRLYELALDPRGAERWTARTPSGDGPADLSGVAMAHDAARDRLLVFGGGASEDTLFALDLSSDPPAWSEIPSRGSTWPAARRDAALALGPEGDAAYLVGGRDGAGPVEDLWRLDLTTDAFDLDGALPGSFVGQAAVVSGDALLLLDVDVGGVSSPHRVALSDLAVTALEPSEASPADARTFGFRDETEARVVLYLAGGGLGGSAWWVADDGSGSPRHRSGVDAPPPLQRAASAVRDEDGAWYVLAGRTAAGSTGDVWRYELGANRWAAMTVSGAPRPEGEPVAARTDAGVALYAHGNAYELVSNGPGLDATEGTDFTMPQFEGGTAIEGCTDTWLAVFGGRLGDGWSNSTHVFVCDAGDCNWESDSATASDPMERGYASADRVSVAGEATPSILLWGGFAEISPLPNEVWTTPPACGSAGVSWQSRSAAAGSRPSGRGGHTLIATDGPAMILFGGASYVSAPRDGLFDELWVLDTSGASVRWTRRRTDGPAPSARAFHVAAWDSAAQRLLVYGGHGPSASQDSLGDLWELRWRPE